MTPRSYRPPAGCARGPPPAIPPSMAFPRHVEQGVDGGIAGGGHNGDIPASHNRRFGYFSANHEPTGLCALHGFCV